MPTSEERREVAARLRDFADSKLLPFWGIVKAVDAGRHEAEDIEI